MISLFRHHAPIGAVLQLATEAVLCFLAVVIAVESQRQVSQELLGISVAPAAAFAALMALACIALGMYRRDRRYDLYSIAVRTALAGALAVSGAYLLFFALPHGDVAQEVLGRAVLFAVGGVFLLRRATTFAMDIGVLKWRVLVVGTGPEAQAVEQALNDWCWGRLAVVGFYEAGAEESRAVPSSRVVSHGTSIGEAVRRLRIDEIIVAVREQRGGVLPMRQMLDCRLAGVRVTDLTRFVERVRGEVPLEALKLSWLVYADGFAQGWLRGLIKRTFDVAAASVLLLLATPVMLVTAAAIRFECAGPVIYRQVRVGQRGRTFTLLKFRSMRADAEQDGRARWAQANDSRVTRIGQFIRKTRIDELPQLINVLRGEMSFVGPRPERPVFVDQLRADIPFYDVRHSVKPGLTGWAQVRYSYGASVEEAVRKLQFELFYVKNHSLALDILILLETVRVVLLREGSR
jgi:sugar transferase (PEP-CTERM system associated)